MKKTIPFLLLIVFFAFAAWYSLIRDTDPVDELQPPSLRLEPAVESMVAHPPADDEFRVEETLPAPQPLPLLGDSDMEITQALSVVTAEDPLAQYLVKDQLISRFVAVIDSLTSRQVPAQINPLKSPEGKFLIATEGERTTFSTENFSRYDGYVVLLQGLESQALVDLYQQYYPLFQQAWEDNGGEGPFNVRLNEVIDHLLGTPETGEEIHLVKPEAVYLFKDPEFEALTAGQKIMLRMGPANAAAVKAKLTEIGFLLPEDFESIRFDYQSSEEPVISPDE